jgi:hypothetical protein
MLRDPRGYMLCVNGDTAVRWIDGNWYDIIFSRSKVKPMKGEMTKFDVFDFDFIKNLLEIKEGDYISLESRTKIMESEGLHALFEKVRNGVEIFPYANEHNKGKGIKIKGERSGKTPLPKPRHWGQEYLGNLTTGDIIEGEFFATGFTYQVFPVNQRMVIEANEENRATYILESEKFDSLRLVSRGKMISEKPEGYVGRVLHKGSRQKWKETLNDYLKRDYLPQTPKKKLYKYSFVVAK